MRFPLLGKAMAIVALAFGLSLVLARISYLVDERADRQKEAVRSVAQSQAAAQTLVGPILQRQCTEQWTDWEGEGKTRKQVIAKRAFTVRSSPDDLQVQSQLRSEPRYRGLFKVNGFVGQFQIDARWDEVKALNPQPERAGATVSCEPATVWLALGDVRGVRSAKALLSGTEFPVRPGTPSAELPQGFHLQLPKPWPLPEEAGPLTARIELALVGTSQLALAPVGERTAWRVQSDWPHPSFGGRFLPTQREVVESGFKAEWAVSSLSSSASRAVLEQHGLCAARELESEADGAAMARMTLAAEAHEAGAAKGCLDTMAVSFIDPVNPYSLSDRAIKYGLLFIALTFVSVALVEVLARGRVRRVHPIQYALVGLALTLFFLLLLSLSEHVAFGIAYTVASAACVLLLGVYTAHMLGRRGDGVRFGLAMALLYGGMYVLLQKEQAALVIGSVGLFLAVAAVMWLTRRVDWYRLMDESRQTAAARAEVVAGKASE